MKGAHSKTPRIYADLSAATAETLKALKEEVSLRQTLERKFWMRNIYVLYDLVAETWVGQLLVDRHEAPVIRMFHDLLKDTKTQPGQHPEDYEIRLIGKIDDEGGIDVSPPRTVATGSAWAAAQSQEK